MVGPTPQNTANSFDTTQDDSLRDLAAGKLIVEQLSIVRMPRLVEIYYVSGAELDTLASGYSSVHMAFLGIVAGASVTLIVTVATVQLSDRQLAVFVTLAAFGLLATLYFAVRAFSDWRRQVRQIGDIKQSRESKAV